MRRAPRVVLAATAALVTLAACSSGGQEPASTAGASTSASAAPESSAPAETPSASPSATETPQPANPADETDDPGAGAPFSTEPQSSADWPGSGGDLLPVGVRVGAHDGFERVVFDLEGADTPGWRVEYVDSAITEGKGDEIDVAGDATLQVVLTGFRYPEPSETGKLAQGSYAAKGTDEIDEVYVAGIFEGQNQAFIGLDEQVPFRVFHLANPARVVVDVQTGRG
ncbi:AMIN-like domain-containing (lipo)protein [Georgenia thermotolerans]|uniref:AMIN-like domain-containing protein n=1 Tax=Georgenia thermotolerans TaxID=527326 RepID=A0A7J5UJ66_9MICO|nr:hypothetical protein [Georgenia thermotolerans]KAE8762427.1 hypothetical protein GB883_19420 [Georgenia thermotolerans]